MYLAAEQRPPACLTDWAIRNEIARLSVAVAGARAWIEAAEADTAEAG